MFMNTAKKILIVDDETDVIEVLTFLLQCEGYLVEAATNGKEGWDKIAQQSYSAVVCDLCMPEMDGLTLLKKIRGDNNLTPFIFLSGHANAMDELEMANYGVYELLHKPKVQALLLSLKSLLKADNEVKVLKNASPEANEFLQMVHSVGSKVKA